MSPENPQAAFNTLFGTPPEGEAIAPGRVNLLGEFTDYNDGFVLPVAMDRASRVLWRQRNDQLIRVASLQYPDQLDSFAIDADYANGPHVWTPYVRGVVAASRSWQLESAGVDLLIDSQVPEGKGLSSSAALEVSLLGALNQINGWGLSPTDIARIGQLAENDFVGCQCGIMDQLVSACALANHALLIDCASLECSPVPLPTDWAILVVDSNHPRQLVGSEYNQRRLDCEEARDHLEVPSLRHATKKTLAAHRAELSDNAYRRALHVIGENERVLTFVEVIKMHNLSLASAIMAAGQRSLSENFEITVPATDTLVALAHEALGNRVAARQTGGGFGGAVVCLCHQDNVDSLRDIIDQRYSSETGLRADISICSPSNGLEVTTFE
jgi:galactokinase